MDLIMPLDEFNPYKDNVSMQRRIMGKTLLSIFSANIHKYIYKLPRSQISRKRISRGYAVIPYRKFMATKRKRTI